MMLMTLSLSPSWLHGARSFERRLMMTVLMKLFLLDDFATLPKRIPSLRIDSPQLKCASLVLKLKPEKLSWIFTPRSTVVRLTLMLKKLQLLIILLLIIHARSNLTTWLWSEPIYNKSGHPTKTTYNQYDKKTNQPIDQTRPC